MNKTAPASVLAWPPPALESLQGAAWRAITLLGLGAFTLVPLLLAVVVRQPFWSAGPVTGAWWMPLASASLASVLIMAGIVSVIRILFHGARATSLGHHWSTVGLVAADSSHDSGFLLLGERGYARMSSNERSLIIRARILSVVCYATSLIWIPAAFAIGIALAARNVIGTGTSLLALVFVPAALLMLSAIGARLVELGARRSRKHAPADFDEHDVPGAVARWLEVLAAQTDRAFPAPSAGRGARSLAWALAALLIIIPVPLLSVGLASAAGPLVVSMATPRWSSTLVRSARITTLAAYSPAPDASVSAAEAGATMHVIASGGRDDREGVLPPARTLPPLPRAPDGMFTPGFATTTLFSEIDDLTAEQIEYLEASSRHPVHAEIARVSRAASADLAAARLDMPALAGVSLWQLPLPRFGVMREAAHLHAAKAVLETSRGDFVQAEQTLRETVGLGTLLAREGGSAMEVIIGIVIAGIGMDGLERFYDATGRPAEALAIRSANNAMEAAERMAPLIRQTGTEHDLSLAMRWVSDDALPQGLRWESLGLLQVGSPCVNAHSAVFGRGAAYTAWLQRTQEQLVRYPSQQPLFDLTSAPFSRDRQNGLVRAVFGLTLSRDEAGNCANLLASVADDLRNQ